MAFAAYLADGRTAEHHPVWIHIDPRRLILLDRDGRRLDEWPLEGLSLLEEVYREQPIRLRHRARGEACLTVEEPAFLEALGRVSPAWRRRTGRGRAGGRRLAGAVLGLALALVGLVWLVPRLARTAARWVPPAWEEAWGGAIERDLEARLSVCKAASGQAALEALSARLVAEAGTAFPFRVRVLDDGAVNAFALPGGHVALLRGLIAAARSPEEVAGVLAHEMAHVARHHPTEALLRAAGLRLVAHALAGDLGGPPGTLAEFGRGLAELSYGRVAEREADRAAAELLGRAGIGSAGLIAFLRRAETGQNGSGEAPEWLSSHPDPGSRARALAALPAVAARRPPAPALSPEQWRALQAICR